MDEECKLADKSNPVTISFSLKDNYYNAKSKEIQLSLNKNAYDLLSKFG
jgi:hypothetical protein